MKKVLLPAGEAVPAMGMGTWQMAQSAGTRAAEIASLRLGLELGLSLIDSAEMYGDGRAEELVGEAIGGRRDEVFLVTKVLPSNAGFAATLAACERSLRHLRTDRIDLYLLHWRGATPLAETLRAFVALQAAGKIRHWGVSNLDCADMRELLTAGGAAVQTNQLLYNLARRGIEWELLPMLREHRIPVMAYSPLEQARLVQAPKLQAFGRRNGITPGQAALAWLLAKDDVIAIPKTGSSERLQENFAATQIQLTPAQLAELDQLFKPPTRPSPLEMI